MIDLITQHIGDYTLDESIGVGELGEVFRATDRRTGQLCAVKVIHAETAVLPGFSERFRQNQEEVRLQHAYIITTFESGDFQERPYVAMELAPGGSLVRLLQQRSRSEKDVPLSNIVGLIRQGIDALVFAHAQGVKHLNLKPSNMLLVDDPDLNVAGASLTLKLSDFGLLRQSEDVLEYPTKIVESLAYRPPEWFLDLPLDERSDIYSLGVILYETTTGYLPFKAKTFNDAWQTHFARKAPPDVRKVRPQLPEALGQIIMRCLAHEPDSRFGSVSELAEALDGVIESGSLEPPKPKAAPSAAVLARATIIKPRVRVMDQNGQPISTVDLTGEGLVVSGHKDSDITLPEGEQAKQDVVIDWSGSRATVTSQNDAPDVRLENRNLKPEESLPWTPGTLLQVGSLWLSLEATDTSETQAGAAVNGAVTTGSLNGSGNSDWSANGSAGRLVSGDGLVEGISGVQSEEVANTEATVTRIILLPDDDGSMLMVTPGTPETFRFTIANQSNIVDNYKITVSGDVPESWVVLPARPVKLLPNDRTQVRLTVNVPALPSSLAKDYQVTITATSVSDSKETGTFQTIWRVLPFHKYRPPDITPRSATRHIRRQLYLVTIRNESNIPQTYTNELEENEGLYFKLQPNTPVKVDPGKSARLKLYVRPKNWIWFGQSTKHRFDLRTRVETEAEPSLQNATYDQEAIFAILRWFLLIPMLVGSASYLFGVLPIPREKITTPLYGVLNPPTPTIPPTVDISILLTPPVVPTVPPTPTEPPTITPTFPPPTATLTPTVTPVPPTATPGPICYAGQPFEISGRGPASTGLLLLFDKRPVGGGTTDASGRYKIVLRVGNEQSGRHLVSIRTRPANELIRQFTCIVP